MIKGTVDIFLPWGSALVGLFCRCCVCGWVCLCVCKGLRARHGVWHGASRSKIKATLHAVIWIGAIVTGLRHRSRANSTASQYVRARVCVCVRVGAHKRKERDGATFFFTYVSWETQTQWCCSIPCVLITQQTPTSGSTGRPEGKSSQSRKKSARLYSRKLCPVCGVSVRLVGSCRLTCLETRRDVQFSHALLVCLGPKVL